MLEAWLILLQVTLVAAGKLSVDLVETAAYSDPKVQHDAYGQGLTNTQNVAYTGTISIGTPRQNFRVRFDTGSQYTWVPVRGCKEGNKKCGSNQYNPNKSRTSRNVTGTFQVKTQNGTARGSFFEDVVEFSPADGKTNFRLPKPVIFGGATQLTNGVEAVVGLPSINTFDRKSNKETSLLHTALNSRALEKPIFTVYMGSCQDDKCKKNGKITFGGYDEENCGPRNQILWTQLSDNSPQWTVKLASINVGPRSIGQNIPVVSDTGSPTLSFPPTLYNQLIRWLKVKPQKNGKIVVPCGTYLNISFSDKEGAMPIPSANLMRKTGKGNDCEVLIDSKPGKVVFGAPFIRSYCQVYDIKNRQLGIIPPAEHFDDQDDQDQDEHDDQNHDGHNHDHDGDNHDGHNHDHDGNNHDGHNHDHGNGGCNRCPPYDPYGRGHQHHPKYDPYNGHQHQHGKPEYGQRYPYDNAADPNSQYGGFNPFNPYHG